MGKQHRYMLQCSDFAVACFCSSELNLTGRQRVVEGVILALKLKFRVPSSVVLHR